MGDKRQQYEEQMTVWKSQYNHDGAQKVQHLSPPPTMRASQSENSLPELVMKDEGVSSVNLRSHSDIRYHLNVLEPTYYLDRQRTEQYRRELDEQIREKNRIRMQQERKKSGGVELASLMARRSPSLPKLPYLNSTDVTRPFNCSPRMQAFQQISPQTYHNELARQEQVRKHTETFLRQREKEESNQHFNSWAMFWGRPGHGAPVRVNHKKENLFKLLHYNGIRK